MVICFYHCCDHDGQSAAVLVKQAFPDCKLIPMNYGYKIPWDIITLEDTVFMVDFCFEPADRMKHLMTRCKELIWIDHHVSSIDEVKKVGIEPAGLRMIDKSGCELTWRYLHPQEKMPLAIYLIGRFDVFDHLDPRVLPFHYGLLAYDTDPDHDDLWTELLTDEDVIDRLIREGTIIQRYQTQVDKVYAEGYSFDVKLDEYRGIAMNLGRGSSLVFESVWDPDKYDVMLSFSYNDGVIGVSAYTDKPDVDVSKLALKYGGGGHKQAAGWSVKDPAKFFKQISAN